MLRSAAPKMLAFARAAAVSDSMPALAAARSSAAASAATNGSTYAHDTPPSALAFPFQFPHTRPFSAQAAVKEPAEPSVAAAHSIPQHPSATVNFCAGEQDSYMLMHPVYEKEYVESIVPKHQAPTTLTEKTGYYAVLALRTVFDKATGYGNNMTVDKWLHRMIYLETVAGVPGMVGGALRHMRSLRTMKRDHGWIHTLLEEAENERMHLLTFMQLREQAKGKNSALFRGLVLGGQGVFVTLYTLFYAISPKHCHAFVAYLEEEAVKTYTHALSDIEQGKIPEWVDAPAPPIAVEYWRLGQGATMRDLFLAVRADEACHQHVNAVLCSMKADESNPFAKGSAIVP